MEMAPSDKILNPFAHELGPASLSDRIRTAIFAVTVLPVRVILCLISLISTWITISIALYGVAKEDLATKPLKDWRISINKKVSLVFFRLTFMALGFHRVSVKGKLATRKEAPILVAAPHSTFIDTLVVTVLGGPSVISRLSNFNIPIFGKIVSFIQPVFVDRDDRDSRQNAVRSVLNRVTSPDDWPQVLIFPEGTCTNRSCLISFALGAFSPGVPVQPVLIRYPNKVDTLSWTWYGPSALKTLWYTVTQTHTNCAIELLPVYRPNDDEKKNPELYAQNVQKIMAKALGVPIYDYAVRDYRTAKRACELGLPPSSFLVKMQKLRDRLRLVQNKVEEEWIKVNSDSCKSNNGPVIISISDFAALLKVDENDRNLEQLFKMYAEDGKLRRTLNWQHYLLSVRLMNEAESVADMARMAFEYFDGCMNKNDFQIIMRIIYSMSNEDSERIFTKIVREGETIMTYDSYLAAEKKSAIHFEPKNKKKD